MRMRATETETARMRMRTRGSEMLSTVFPSFGLALLSFPFLPSLPLPRPH